MVDGLCIYEACYFPYEVTPSLDPADFSGRADRLLNLV